MFDRLDANHDGYLTRDEIRYKAQQNLQEKRRGESRLSQMDTNGDGSISRDEWQGPSAVFDRLDSNHDGSITQEEIQSRRRD
jgi:Ca2+-binding EF-hand superfamily protein